MPLHPANRSWRRARVPLRALGLSLTTMGEPVRISSAPTSAWHYASPIGLVHGLWVHRSLVWQFTVREVAGRYRGSRLGFLWSFLNPLAMLAVYTFVFGGIFHTQWAESPNQSTGAFALTLFCGLTVFSLFSECVSRAPGLIVANPQYVKKVVVPLEALPVAIVGAGLFHAIVNLVILLIGRLVVFGTLHWGIVYVVPVLVPLALLTLGVVWFLASLGVFVRDTGHTVAILVNLLFFLTPIFYPPSAVPEPARTMLMLNPLATIVQEARRTLMWGQALDWAAWSGVALGSVIIAQLGYVWFMKTKRGFADVV